MKISIEDEEPQMLCSSCARLISPESEFCPHCTAPLGATTNIDPLRSIWGRSGFILWQVLHGTPTPFARGVVILGLVCLILLPLMGLASQWREGFAGVSSGAVLYLNLAVPAVAAYVLWRVLTSRPANGNHP